MAQKIVIEGDKVQVIDESVRAVTTIDALLDNMCSKRPVNLGLMPKDMIYYRRLEDKALYVVEVSPKIVRTQYTENGKGVSHECFWSIPFVQFYFMVTMNRSMPINSTRLSVTKTRITSEDQPIFIAPFCNLHGGGKDEVCQGNVAIDLSLPIHLRIEAAISAYFASDFNDDLSPAIPSAVRETGKPPMMVWSEKSQADRFFGLSSEVEYLPFNKTFLERVNNICG